MDTQQSFGNDVAAFQYFGGRGIVPNALVKLVEIPNGTGLRINVVFTDLRTTEIALRHAVDLAMDLAAETQIIVPHVVPYPLALECPAVPLEFTCSRLQRLAGSVGADPYIQVYLCRDVIGLLRELLPEGSIVVLSARKRWPVLTNAGRIARALRKKGCVVILV